MLCEGLSLASAGQVTPWEEPLLPARGPAAPRWLDASRNITLKESLSAQISQIRFVCPGLAGGREPCGARHGERDGARGAEPRVSPAVARGA